MSLQKYIYYSYNTLLFLCTKLELFIFFHNIKKHLHGYLELLSNLINSRGLYKCSFFWTNNLSYILGTTKRHCSLNSKLPWVFYTRKCDESEDRFMHVHVNLVYSENKLLILQVSILCLGQIICCAEKLLVTSKYHK